MNWCHLLNSHFAHLMLTGIIMYLTENLSVSGIIPGANILLLPDYFFNPGNANCFVASSAISTQSFPYPALGGVNICCPVFA